MKRLRDFLAVLSILILCDMPDARYAQSAESIGQFVVVNGKVIVTPRDAASARPVRLKDAVHFKDRIETLKASKAKVLFVDDTIMSLGENTVIEITEQIYDPAKDRRSTKIELLAGKARALVGRFFSGSGSTFEIHTPTAVAASRGSYAIIWIEDVDGKPATGILNIGGKWEVRNIDPKITGSVFLEEGSFTQVFSGLPPLPPADAKPDLWMRLEAATEGKEKVRDHAPAVAVLQGGEGAQETVTPITETRTTPGAGLTNDGNVEGVDTGTATAPPVPPIVNQPPPTTTPVGVEIRFP